MTKTIRREIDPHERLGKLVDTLKNLQVSSETIPIGDFMCYVALLVAPENRKDITINMNRGGEIYPIQISRPRVRLCDTGSSASYEFSSKDKSSRVYVKTKDLWEFDKDSNLRDVVFTEMLGFPKDTLFYIRPLPPKQKTD